MRGVVILFLSWVWLGRGKEAILGFLSIVSGLFDLNEFKHTFFLLSLFFPWTVGLWVGSAVGAMEWARRYVTPRYQGVAPLTTKSQIEILAWTIPRGERRRTGLRNIPHPP